MLVVRKNKKDSVSLKPLLFLCFGRTSFSIFTHGHSILPCFTAATGAAIRQHSLKNNK